jgi:hypothetical protein
MKTYRSLIDELAREKKMMTPEMNYKGRPAVHVSLFLAAAVVVMIFAFAATAADAATKQKTFASPEEAVKTFDAAMKSNDNKELIAIFGPAAKEVIYSGDPVSDKERREKFIKAFDLKNSLDREGDKMVLIVGEKDWPFPIPLVKKGDRWFFDTKAGMEEILNRRIGEDELNTIQTMLAIVDAEREYAMRSLKGGGVAEYAQKFRSDPGKKNGLYWQTGEGEEPSPLGKLVADARAEAYVAAAKAQTTKGPMPYHGYYFKMLKKQGKHAPEGAFDYIVRGKQIGGFAVVAYPARYGNSGVMTFMVNHEGVVYQKDLGKNTANTAKAMKSFDPDKTWKKVEVTSKQ